MREHNEHNLTEREVEPIYYLGRIVRRTRPEVGIHEPPPAIQDICRLSENCEKPKQIKRGPEMTHFRHILAKKLWSRDECSEPGREQIRSSFRKDGVREHEIQRLDYKDFSNYLVINASNVKGSRSKMA